MKKIAKMACAMAMLMMLVLSGVSAMAQTVEAEASAQSTNIEAVAKKAKKNKKANGESKKAKAQSEFKGTVKIKLVNKEKLCYGDTVTLKAQVKVNAAYNLQWQVKQGGEWKDMEGETGKTLKYEVTPKNHKDTYRVMVTAA